MDNRRRWTQDSLIFQLISEYQRDSFISQEIPSACVRFLCFIGLHVDTTGTCTFKSKFKER